MGQAYTVFTSQRSYRVIDDLTTHYVVFVAGRVLAAEDNSALTTFRVSCSRPDIQVKVTDGGFFCLAGTVAQLFPLLSTQAYNFTITISAPHYRTITVPITIPMGATFPITLPDNSLVAEAVRVQGRTTLNSSGVAVPAATILLNSANILTLRTPLHFDHAVGATINPCTITVDATVHTLTNAAPQAATSLFLDDRTGLAANGYLRLGTEPSYEYLRIDSIPGSLAQPGEVRLSTPMHRSAPIGATVTAVSITSGVPARTFSEARFAGEALLLVSGTITASHIEIVGAIPAQSEAHALNALSDAQGNYRIDGISRVRNGPFFASTATLEAEIEWLIDYRRPVNTLDFRLRPP